MVSDFLLWFSDWFVCGFLKLFCSCCCFRSSLFGPCSGHTFVFTDVDLSNHLHGHHQINHSFPLQTISTLFHSISNHFEVIPIFFKSFQGHSDQLQNKPKPSNPHKLTPPKLVDHRVEFSKWWVAEFKSIKLPATGTVFDYYIDSETKRFELWSKKVQPFTLDPGVSLKVGRATFWTP